MNDWILVGASSLKKQEQQESTIAPLEVKVKVTHVMASNFDSLVFGGKIKADYPVTLGRFAVGIVTEAGKDCYGVSVGNRVYFKPTKGCGECFACKSGKEDSCTEVKIAGKNYNGFLRDFVVCDYREVEVLPDSVDDFHALCIEYVGLAERIYDRLNLSAGQTVAIFGGRFLGNIIAQVLQYHKIVPIIIDNNDKNLERAQKAGVSYAFRADDDLYASVNEATCGRFCDGAVYNTSSKISPSVCTAILANNKDMVLGGFSNVSFSINAQDIIEKQLSVYGISNGYGYTDTAINMLVHGAVNLDMFEKHVLSEFEPAEILKTMFAEADNSSFRGITVLKMIL